MQDNVITYIRISSRDRTTESQKQLQLIRSFVQQNDISVSLQIEDVSVSGYTAAADRPGYQGILRYFDTFDPVRRQSFEPSLRAQYEFMDEFSEGRPDAIVVAKQCRVARCGRELERAIREMQDRNLRIFTADGVELTSKDSRAVRKRARTCRLDEREYANLVERLRQGRDRKRKLTGSTGEGRKGYDRLDPALVRLVQRLHSEPDPATGRPPSLRALSKVLADRGCMTPKGQPFSPSQIKRLLKYRLESASASQH